MAQEVLSQSYLPNFYTPNPLLTKADFQILDHTIHQVYPIIARSIFSDYEYKDWLNHPPSWSFCGSVSLLVCQIYPDSYLVYDRENNHAYNIIITANLSAEIDLTRDQFTEYKPSEITIENPNKDQYLKCLFEDIGTNKFHQLVNSLIKTHPNIKNGSKLLLNWVNSDVI